MSKKRLRVLIAEDEAILQVGIASYLTTNNDSVEIVGTANNGAIAIEKTRQMNPDVVVMDIGMPVLDGIKATRKIKQEMPDTGIVMLTIFTDQEQVCKALDSGADAYCIKDIKMEQLQLAIAAANQGSMYLDAKIARCAVNPDSQSSLPPLETAKSLALDEKDITILQFIADGKSNTEIGKEMNISPNTIKWTINRIFEKLEVRNRVTATLKSWQLGIIDMEF